MTFRDFWIFWLGLMLGIAIGIRRRGDDSGKVRPQRLPREVADNFVAAIAALVFAGSTALLCFNFIGRAYPMMMGHKRWEPAILLAIPSFAAVSGFSTWVGVWLVRVVRKTNRQHYGVNAFFPPPLMAGGHSSSKSAPDDLD